MTTAAAVAIGRGREMARPTSTDIPDVIETYLWVDEHDWLKALHRSPANNSPQFRVPDLLGACISIVFGDDDPSGRIFGYLSRELILRDPQTPRRQERMWREHFALLQGQERMWREHFALLQGLQRSPANRYPHPSFPMDQLTTACVAIVMADAVTDARILDQARLNTAARTGRAPRAIKQGGAS